MIVIDDIVFFPVKSILWIFRELHNSARQELANEADAITGELSELYMMLETGQITETEFDQREKELLDRLEKLETDGTRIDDAEPE